MTNIELFLIFISFFTSATTAALGVGGGALLLAVMATFYPPSILIPVHGVVQLGSNVGRGVLMRHAIKWPVALAYLVGTLIGVGLGMNVFVALPERALSIILAFSILIFIWMPKLKKVKKVPGKNVLSGGLAGFLTLFVGATGVLTAAFLGREKGFTRHNTVATFAACMTSQHALKVLAFALMGFSFAPYAGLMLAMVVTGFLGTWVGKTHLLDRLDEKKFKIVFRIAVTILALRLLVKALTL